MRRVSVHSERGATAVIVAILLVALFGFTALAVDLGAAWADKKQLQNGADAAALAIAQQCAAGTCPGSPNSEADSYAKANKFNATSSATGSAVIDAGAQQVTARAEENLTHWFAPVIGINSSLVAAEATAKWGVFTRATTLPFTISECWFFYQTGSTQGTPPPSGTPLSIPIVSKKNNFPDGNVTCGTQAAHNETAGGFGWLRPDIGVCTATIDVSNPWVHSDPGNSAQDCSALEITLGDRVLMPIFDQWRGAGNNAEYHIKTFAAIEITGYCFGPALAEPIGNPACKNLVTPSGYNLTGRFVEFVDLGAASGSGTGGVNMGAQYVKLIG